MVAEEHKLRSYSLESTQLITDLRIICEMIFAKMHSKYTRLRTFQCKSCSLQWLLSRSHSRAESCKWSRCVTMECIVSQKERERERELCRFFLFTFDTLDFPTKYLHSWENESSFPHFLSFSQSQFQCLTDFTLSVSFSLPHSFRKQRTNARLRMPNSNIRYHDSLTVVLSSLHIYLCILILMKLVFSFHVYIFTQ